MSTYTSRERPHRSIFDDDEEDSPTESSALISHSKMSSSVDHDHNVSQNIAHLPSPAALQQDNFSSRPPAYSTPTHSPPQTRNSYDSPANDPWSSTPRTNGLVPVAAPHFPRRTSSIRQTTATETASYLLDADHITIQKTDEKEGIMGFKHVNYTLGSARRGTQVVRRYSDFSWYDLEGID